jgi:hypothetical protein
LHSIKEDGFQSYSLFIVPDSNPRIYDIQNGMHYGIPFLDTDPSKTAA